MDIARVTSKGQVTIPIGIRKRMNLKEGDKLVFLEQNGKVYVENSAAMAFNKVQEAFEGEAENLGLNDIDDIVSMIKELRAERKTNK